VAGYASDVFGSSVAFAGLAAVAALGLAIIWLAMPETRPPLPTTPTDGVI
jgi:predicted MFS family arabinose efflux permease